MEKIGLVTITYNSADVIRDFLESAFPQTFDNFVIEHVPSHHTGGNGVTMGNDGGIVPPYIRIIKPLILT